MTKSDQQLLESITNETYIIKFWSKVSKTDSCWNWIAGKFSNGYGHFGPMLGISLRTHRFSFVLYNKRLPVGGVVRHKCDNKLCVNPEHLIEGTQQDNVRDRKERNRSRKHANLDYCKYGHDYSITGFYINTKNSSKMCKKCILKSNKYYFV